METVYSIDAKSKKFVAAHYEALSDIFREYYEVDHSIRLKFHKNRVMVENFRDSVIENSTTEFADRLSSKFLLSNILDQFGVDPNFEDQYLNAIIDELNVHDKFSRFLLGQVLHDQYPYSELIDQWNDAKQCWFVEVENPSIIETDKMLNMMEGIARQKISSFKYEAVECSSAMTTLFVSLLSTPLVNGTEWYDIVEAVACDASDWDSSGYYHFIKKGTADFVAFLDKFHELNTESELVNFLVNEIILNSIREQNEKYAYLLKNLIKLENEEKS